MITDALLWIKNVFTWKSQLGRRNVRDLKNALSLYSQFEAALARAKNETMRRPEDIDADSVSESCKELGQIYTSLVESITSVQGRVFSLDFEFFLQLESVINDFNHSLNQLSGDRRNQVFKEAEPFRQKIGEVFGIVRRGRIMAYDALQGKTTLRERSIRTTRFIISGLITNARRERWSIRPVRTSCAAVRTELSRIYPALKTELKKPGSFQRQLFELHKATQNAQLILTRSTTALWAETTDTIIVLQRIRSEVYSIAQALYDLEQKGLATEIRSGFLVHLARAHHIIHETQHSIERHDALLFPRTNRALSLLKAA